VDGGSRVNYAARFGGAIGSAVCYPGITLVGAKPSRRKKSSSTDSARAGSVAADASTVRVRQLPDEDSWELVPPRCALARQDDLEEVRKMIDAGELEVATDECRWLLEGCSDCLDAHRMLGEIALELVDLPLARGHFGYAYRLGAKALDDAGISGPLPYRLPANQSFFEAAKGLVWCLVKLDKRELAAEILARVTRCDPADPLAIARLLADQSTG
jgi:hypothetical protein